MRLQDDLGLLSDFKMIEAIKIIINAIGRTFGNIFWSALGSIICLVTLDWTISGTLVWNYVANDILGTNITVQKISLVTRVGI